MLSLQPLTLEHKDLVDRYLRAWPPEVSELTFANLFIWRDSHPVFLVERAESMVFAAKHKEGLVMLGPPVGPISLREALDAVREALGEMPLMIERATEKALEGFEFAGAQVVEDRDNWDYVYTTSDLIELPGRKFHSKRNLVERCLAAHECVYEPIRPALLREVADMQDRWCKDRDCTEQPGLCEEYRAIRQLLTHCERLGVVGGAVRVDGTVQAYCVGEMLSPDTGVVHVEKAMPEVEGLYQVMNQWFCRNALKDFQYVNREQDMGIPGIRKAKQSYRPHHEVKKYVVQLPAGARGP